jgi:hypothetical protein
MIDFVQKQLETSERLFKLMQEDHRERMREIVHWSITTASLVHKLEERDRIIAEQKEEIETLKKLLRPDE